MSLRTSILVFLVTCLFCGQAQAWELTTGIVEPGDPVVLNGTPARSGDPMVLFFTPEGAATLDNLRATPNGLEGEIGIAAGPFAAPTEIWWGRQFQLPKVVKQRGGFVFAVQTAEAFVGLEKEVVGGNLSLQRGTTDTIMALVVDEDGIGVIPPEWEIPAEEPIMPTIRIDIVIDGGTNNNVNDPNGKYVAVRGHLDIVASPINTSTAGLSKLDDVAGNLGGILDETLGPLGIKVLVEGPKLRFVLVNGHIDRGFVLIRTLPLDH